MLDYNLQLTTTRRGIDSSIVVKCLIVSDAMRILVNFCKNSFYILASFYHFDIHIYTTFVLKFKGWTTVWARNRASRKVMGRDRKKTSLLGKQVSSHFPVTC